MPTTFVFSSDFHSCDVAGSIAQHGRIVALHLAAARIILWTSGCDLVGRGRGRAGIHGRLTAPQPCLPVHVRRQRVEPLELLRHPLVLLGDWAGVAAERNSRMLVQQLRKDRQLLLLRSLDPLTIKELHTLRTLYPHERIA